MSFYITTPIIDTHNSLTAWCNRPANEMQLSYAEWLDRKAGIDPETPVVGKVDGGRARHVVGRMNGIEKRYAAHLDLRKIAGEILDWKFEPLKLKLAPATFYNPDFGVQMLDGHIEIHETKGFWEDDARVKVKVAAEMFPWFSFLGVMWVKAAKTWKFERFG